tara:strand:+ start:154 stop:1353 length:1200 start_codon:yes stop_codon:yes gene_type:complete
MLEKDKMIEYLNIVLDSNISNPDSYIRWCRGFGPELDLKVKLENVFGFEHLPTGWFLYYGTGENFCTYCTISTQKITDKKIKDIYNKISQYTKKLYYIEYSFNRNDSEFQEYTVKDKGGKNVNVKIPKLDIDFYEFKDGEFRLSDENALTADMDKKKASVCQRKGTGKELEYLEKYDFDAIVDIYAQRYLLNVILRNYKGYSCDLDHIGLMEGELSIIESKSKDPARVYSRKWEREREEIIEEILCEEISIPNGDELNKILVPDLKVLCQSNGLIKSRNKPQLIKILLNKRKNDMERRKINWTSEDTKKLEEKFSEMGGEKNDKSKWIFGWDWRRFCHYMDLYYKTKIEVLYVIEKINNKFERKPVSYKKIALKDALIVSSWGDGGVTNNIPYNNFKEL